MTDAPKHHPTAPDPANELASDHSPIDPRDFRNALGTYATGVTIITAMDGDEPAGVAANPDLVGRTPWQVYTACVQALTAAGLPDARATATHEDGRLVVTVTRADPGRVRDAVAGFALTIRSGPSPAAQTAANRPAEKGTRP